MEHRFDELAKALAGGLSRREALRRLGGGMAVALLASLGTGRAEAQGGSLACLQRCKGVGGDPRNKASWQRYLNVPRLLRGLPVGAGSGLRHDDDGERGLLPGHGHLLWDGLLPDRSGVLQRELLSRRSVLQRELLQRGPDLPGWAVWDTRRNRRGKRRVRTPYDHAAARRAPGCAGDPLPEIAPIARTWGSWLHVDVACAAWLFSDRHRRRLRGMAEADSLGLDFCPLLGLRGACSVFLVRDAAAVERLERGGWLSGVKETAPPRADVLKLWICLQVLGRRELAAIVDEAMDRFDGPVAG